MRSFVISNKNGVSIKLLSYGGIINEINVPDKYGKIENIVLSYSKLRDYINDEFYIGALIGRYANRVKNSSFTINGINYELEPNEGLNHLHGGKSGFHKVEWTVDSQSKYSVTLSNFYKHLENGYPGNLKVKVKYTISKNNIFDVEFFANSDLDTHFNPTIHPYFNLNPASKTILNHNLKINSKNYLPIDDQYIPTNETKNVKSTPFDFQVSKKIGIDIQLKNKQLEIAKGYDHCFVLDKEQNFAAKLSESESGRLIQIYTDQPGIQLYTGNHLKGIFLKNQGLCLETQHFPNSPNISSFPSTLLKANTNYYSKTSYHLKNF